MAPFDRSHLSRVCMIIQLVCLQQFCHHLPVEAQAEDEGSRGSLLSAGISFGLNALFGLGGGGGAQSKQATGGSTRATKSSYSAEQLESALSEPNVTCGRVPIFEKQLKRSINETFNANPDGDFRILHGLDAKAGEWPWVVRIKECPGEQCGSCTGSLLNSRWVITAGHCGYNRTSVDKYVATIGLYDMITPDKTAVTVRFDRLIVHPDYKDLDNDLTLLRLKVPVQFNDYIQPLCLVNATRNVLSFAKNRKCYSIGYGLTQQMAVAIKLQKLEIQARQASECNSDKLNNIQLRRGTICIGPAKKLGSSCRGDSGGPNQCYDPTSNKWYLIGTVSYGPADCDRSEEDKWLSVSVDVSNYRTWILSTILANGA